MAIQLRTRKTGPGFVGFVVCIINKQRLWSETTGIVRVTREDARKDAAWLRDQQLKAQALMD
jgi:hypothetical protein